MTSRPHFGNDVIFRWRHGRFKSYLRLFLDTELTKNAQISENLKNWETFRYLNNFKFLEVICNGLWLKVELIRNKVVFLKGFITKKNRGGKNASPI